MVDFANLLLTAQRLINENGRSVTLIGFDETLQNASRPWLGAADPRGTPAVSVTTDAVFVPPAGASQLGLSFTREDVFARAEQIAIVSAGANQDMDVFQEVIDGSTRWKITGVQVLRPEETTLVSFLALRR